MSAEDYPGKRVIEALGCLAGPANLQRDLDGFFDNYEAGGRRSAQMPLTALSAVAATRIESEGQQDVAYGGIDPRRTVEVPWWLIWAISQFWLAYKASEGRRTLGQAFGIEAARQGERSTTKTRKTQANRMGYALEVAWERLELNISIERAIGIVADRWSVSDSLVKQAWDKYREPASRAIRRAHG